MIIGTKKETISTYKYKLAVITIVLGETASVLYQMIGYVN